MEQTYHCSLKVDRRGGNDVCSRLITVRYLEGGGTHSPVHIRNFIREPRKNCNKRFFSIFNIFRGTRNV